MPNGQYTPQAVGSYEAACLMGVHWSRPGRMLTLGRLSAHRVADSAYVSKLTKTVAIFDSEECERDYEEYEELQAAGEHGKRPRAWLNLRPQVIRRLQAVKQPISFDDAISLSEAARVLGVHVSLCVRLIKDGDIVGRQAWSERATGDRRQWIVSRKSCQQNYAKMVSREAAGTKPGRPRKKVY